MHVVVWTSAGQRYAIPSATVVEVIPVVQSRPIPGSEPWLVGLFDYRGALLPLVDSSRLLGHATGDYRMSSRIVVMQLPAQEAGDERRVGLLVERVLSTERLEFDGTQPAASIASALEFLGPVAATTARTVQLMTFDRLRIAKN